MQLDFHYYATYCASILAGFSHEESLNICSSAQFTDCCTRTYLSAVKAPPDACTTQSAAEMAALRMTKQDRMDLTRIWSSFHFLPLDLYSKIDHRPKNYVNKYHLICGTNGALLYDTVMLAKAKAKSEQPYKSLEAVGIAMHILADTWAHKYFAGTPSLVINNTDFYFSEIIDSDEGQIEKPIHLGLNSDNHETGSYMSSIKSLNEHSVMNLGHGRAGHLPDYSFIHYRYLPAWGNYRAVDKDNPNDYLHAFTQMIYAMKYLRGAINDFELKKYDFEAIEPYRNEIEKILRTRRFDASADWKAFGERLSGAQIPDFDPSIYSVQYQATSFDRQSETFLGRFILSALAQKSMITHKIYNSGNPLAGRSIEYNEEGFKGIASYKKLIEAVENSKKGEKA